MKRLIVLLISVLILLTGCGNNDMNTTHEWSEDEYIGRALDKLPEPVLPGSVKSKEYSFFHHLAVPGLEYFFISCSHDEYGSVLIRSYMDPSTFPKTTPYFNRAQWEDKSIYHEAFIDFDERIHRDDIEERLAWIIGEVENGG